jgi:alpha-beta hydrolase superfamily lysophospholipase
MTKADQQIFEARKIAKNLRSQSSKKYMIIRIIVYPLFFYSLICLALYLYQDSLIFHPPEPNYPKSSPHHISEISFEHDGAHLYGWMINKEQAKEKIVFYYGGNAEDVYYNHFEFKDIHDACFILINYRGYGSSTGEASQDTLFSDSNFIFNEVKNNFNPKTIIVFGRSLGTGVATYISSKNMPDGLILSTPFDSILEISKSMYPTMPISILLKHPFMSTEYVKELSCPTIVLYGTEDRIVPPENTLNLVKHFKQKPILIEIVGASHNRIDSYSAYRDQIKNFIQATTSQANQPR